MIKINLAPPITKTRATVPGLDLGLIFGAIAALAVVLLGGYWWMLAGQAAGLRSEIEQNQRELTRLQPVIAEGQKYRQEKEDLERRVNAIEIVARNQARSTYLLDSLADTLPPDLWLTKVEEKSQQVRLGGTSYTSVALADFMANLKASGKFKEVDLVESRQDLSRTPRTITFEVSCQFEI